MSFFLIEKFTSICLIVEVDEHVAEGAKEKQLCGGVNLDIFRQLDVVMEEDGVVVKVSLLPNFEDV